jgi:uncharacterized protein YbjQ (UPF0145 family)
MWLALCRPSSFSDRAFPEGGSMTLPYYGGRIAGPMVTTALELPGFRIVRSVGLVRGIVVRSRSVVGTFVAGLQTILGGNISIWTHMCEQAREDSYRIMVQHAQELGANAIIAMRYDANEVANGVTEVLSYGTAVMVEPLPG